MSAEAFSLPVMAQSELTARHPKEQYTSRDELLRNLAETAVTRAADWREQALCSETDPDLFFPEPNEGKSRTRAAKLICERCEVRLECLATAIENHEQYGIWGGLSPRERGQVRRQRRTQRS